MGWKIHHMDVKTTFLNGVIEEEVYIEQPKVFETFYWEFHVCRIKRELYGLKQAPHAWYTRIDSYLTGLGFTKTKANTHLCHIMLIRSCKEDLAREFEMKDMALKHYFLRLEVLQGNGELFVSQGRYANEILQRFYMESCKPMETPLSSNWRKEDATSTEEVYATICLQLVGSLMYLVNT
eukprot:PITA_23351